MNQNPPVFHPSMYVTHDVTAIDHSYKILNSLIVPRPIALITTINLKTGVVNAAPYSYFNAVCCKPVLISVSIERKAHGLKDTARNIFDTQEFVINICSLNMAQAVSCTGQEVSSEVSEIDLAKLDVLPSTKIRPPRIANTLVQFECRLEKSVEYGQKRGDLFIAEVVCSHIHRDLFKENGHIDIAKLDPLARLAGTTYARITDFFDV